MESRNSGLDHLMGKELFPFPGVRFNPTDVELVMFFLLRKVMGRKCPVEVIAEVDVYKVSPWDLPDKSIVKGDLKWYFLCPIEKKYSAGARMNRATDVGHWKITGNERLVHYDNKLVGSIKTLIFHMGKAPGKRTDWVIHEYRLDNKYLAERGVAQNGHVLCMIFHKDGLGPKNNAQYGAPFKEEDWNNDEVGFVEVASSGFPTPASVLPNNYSSSLAAGTSQCDGTASESYLSETVLSECEMLPAVHSINVVSKKFNQVYDGDVTFSTSVVLNEDKKNKNPIHDGTDESTICKDLGDLVNTAGLSEGGFNFSTGSPDNCLYMGDLRKPLPPEAGESQHVSTNDLYPGYNANIHSELSPLNSCDAAQQISVSDVCDLLPGFKNVSHNGLAELSSDEHGIYEGLGDLGNTYRQGCNFSTGSLDDIFSIEDLEPEAAEPQQVLDFYQMAFPNQKERKRKRQEDNDEIK
ncbi:NAC domain-containing protein 40-like [Quercus lobata]|uniref:NAC domain-containing protein n=1 Tax=Quercus lobata TaxID=97700 RepID=A0A7N2LYH5_QUELO|nr:NAC domain-containing protein 40-like [Quercus lobata]